MRPPSPVTQISHELAVKRWHGEHRGLAQRKAATMPPSLESRLMEGWDSRVERDAPGYFIKPRKAHVWLGEAVQGLRGARYRAAYDESLIRDHAENYSLICCKLTSLVACRRFGAQFGVVPPKARGMTPESERMRWCDGQWWRRQLRRVWTREAENAMRGLGIIRKGRQPYASDEAIEHRAARARRTAEWLKSRVMVNGDGEQLELLKLAEHSIANPAIRRTEIMVRARGFDEAAEALGHECDFWTLTTPSAFHAQHSAGGENAAWAAADRPRVQAAQKWLCRMWARVRAKLARCHIEVYGIRTAEPHHDATPHWHLQLFGTDHALSVAAVVIRAVWLSEYADEKGAAQFRVKVERIDRAKGSPVGYIAKYISKNIDGHGQAGDMDSDETGTNARDATARVLAWARVHGIRQFQQYGGPPVGKWRELRRLREEVAPEDIEAARAAADRNSWADYMRLAGNVALVRETVRDGITTRPACSVNRYGEQQPARVVGLRDWCGEVVTRPHRWRIERKASCAPRSDACSGGDGRRMVSFSESARAARSDLGPVAITVRSEPQGPDLSIGVDLSWVMTVPFRGSAPSLSNPQGWTSRETSMAGPVVLQ